jgi:hypothetical protein
MGRQAASFEMFPDKAAKRRHGLLCLLLSYDENIWALLAGLPKEAIHIENPVQDVIFKVLQISYFISKDKVVVT